MIISLPTHAHLVGARELSPIKPLPSGEDSEVLKPSVLDLAQQRHLAKELLRDWKSGVPEALARLGHHPRPAKVDKRGPRLADAQTVIAREHGFHRWSNFKTFLEAQRLIRTAAIRGENIALDADVRTLHITCGLGLQKLFAAAGFVGDYLALTLPHQDCPVPAGSDLDELVELDHVSFAQVSSAYGRQDWREKDRSRIAALKTARHYERVCLWFANSPDESTMLVFLLDYFSEPANRPSRLDMVTVRGFPGIRRFVNLRQFDVPQIRQVFSWMRLVEPSHIHLAKQVWKAVSDPSPQTLYEMVEEGMPLIWPWDMAFRHHLLHLPALDDGLSLVERLVLKLLAEEGEMSESRLGDRMLEAYCPLPCYWAAWFYAWPRLAALNPSAISVSNQKTHHQNSLSKNKILSITATGLDLLTGRKAIWELNPIERWVGGVRIDYATDHWCWDRDADRPVLRQAKIRFR